MVVNSRPHKQRSEVWRRRECSSCDNIFTTYEQPSLDYTTRVMYSNGENEAFSIGKLSISIYKSFAHDSKLGEKMCYSIARTIEVEMLAKHSSKNKSNKIVLSIKEIQLTSLVVLKRIDKNAAHQYAAKHNILQKL